MKTKSLCGAILFIFALIIGGLFWLFSKELASRDLRIKELEMSNSALNQQLDVLNREADTREQRIQALEHSVIERNTKITQLESDVKSRDQSLYLLQTELNKKEATIKKIEEENKALRDTIAKATAERSSLTSNDEKNFVFANDEPELDTNQIPEGLVSRSSSARLSFIDAVAILVLAFGALTLISGLTARLLHGKNGILKFVK